MILMLHILIALATVGGAVVTAIRPTAGRRRAVYAGIGATILSGVALIVVTPDTLAHACVSGGVTLAATLGLQYVAQRHLIVRDSKS